MHIGAKGTVIARNMHIPIKRLQYCEMGLISLDSVVAGSL